MKNIGYFEKVSYKQFEADVKDNEELYSHICNSNIDIPEIYRTMQLPQRATPGSAGYDFFFPFNDYMLSDKETIVIPTGIKVDIKDEWFLGLFPKSSFGLRYRIKLDDTVSVIDGDYYNCINNEGHIIVKMTNLNSNKQVKKIHRGDGYCQGIFLEYGITGDDSPKERMRLGGFGSTNNPNHYV